MEFAIFQVIDVVVKILFGRNALQPKRLSTADHTRIHILRIIFIIVIIVSFAFCLSMIILLVGTLSLS